MSRAAPRLWLVRHARPLVADGVCYGRLDLAADPHATRAAACALVQALPARLAVVRHSPLQRCEQLALAVQALRPDLTFTPEARIRELDFGAWEGRSWQAIGAAEVGVWSADLARHAPGGGEPLAAMLTRVAQALASDALHARQQRADVVWISHAGVARCLRWLLAHGAQHLPTAQQWRLRAPGYGRWQRFTL